MRIGSQQEQFGWSGTGANAIVLTDATVTTSDAMDVSLFEFWAVIIEVDAASDHDGVDGSAAISFCDGDGNIVDTLDTAALDAIVLTTTTDTITRILTMPVVSNSVAPLWPYLAALKKIKLTITNGDTDKTITCRAWVTGSPSR